MRFWLNTIFFETLFQFTYRIHLNVMSSLGRRYFITIEKRRTAWQSRDLFLPGLDEKLVTERVKIPWFEPLAIIAKSGREEERVQFRHRIAEDRVISRMDDG